MTMMCKKVRAGRQKEIQNPRDQTIRFDKADYLAIKKIAELVGVTASEVVRLCVKTVLGTEELQEAVKQRAVVRIGRRATTLTELQEQVKKLEASTEAVRYITGK